MRAEVLAAALGGDIDDQLRELVRTRRVKGHPPRYTLPGTVGRIGPNLTHVGTKEATFPGYLRESILTPDAVIAPDCPGGPCPPDVIAPDCPFGSCQPGIMLQTFGDILTQEQVDALVDYLTTLR